MLATPYQERYCSLSKEENIGRDPFYGELGAAKSDSLVCTHITSCLIMQKIIAYFQKFSILIHNSTYLN